MPVKLLLGWEGWGLNLYWRDVEVHTNIGILVHMFDILVLIAIMMVRHGGTSLICLSELLGSDFLCRQESSAWPAGSSHRMLVTRLVQIWLQDRGRQGAAARQQEEQHTFR